MRDTVIYIRNEIRFCVCVCVCLCVYGLWRHLGSTYLLSQVGLIPASTRILQTTALLIQMTTIDKVVAQS